FLYSHDLYILFISFPTRRSSDLAFEWYSKSAKRGSANVQNQMGSCYQSGIGIEKDEKKAFEWYLKAANSESLRAQYNIGCCYQRSEEHTSELQSLRHLVCRLLLE